MDFQKMFSKTGKNPQSILKIVLGLSFILLVMWLFLVSQMDTRSVSPENSSRVIEQTTDTTSQAAQSEAIAVAEEKQSDAQRVEKKEAPALFQNAFVTFLVLVSLLGGIWYWAKKKEGTNPRKGKTREVDSHQLSESSQLKFLEINEEIWIVGLSENGMNLLHRYPKEEWKEGLPNTPEMRKGKQTKLRNENGNMDFKSLLKVVSN
ncbi:MAG: hypothetical protein CL666_01610 [Balneola sp.]|mgnify:FL=1|nr:hypothetical protein [Balneola sp.]|tara:strand:+ start:66339 stop:66956 length:618 start_codon:yes stop_codon:yes gene_type:complete